MDKIPDRLQQDIDNFLTSDILLPDQIELLYKFITTQSQLPYIVLNKTFDSDQVHQELIEADRKKLFVRYHSPMLNMETEGWYATAIYGQSATHPWNVNTTLDQAHVAAATNVWTETADCMPYFKTVLEDVIGLNNINRCVCFKLMPGGYVDTHTDIPPDWGYKMIQVDFNVHWPDKARWYLEGVPGGIYPTVNGTIGMHSSIAKHAIVNHSDEPRYLIWAFAEYDTRYKKLVVESYLKQYAI